MDTREAFEAFAKKHMRRTTRQDGAFLRDCGDIEPTRTYELFDIEDAWLDWQALTQPQPTGDVVEHTTACDIRTKQNLGASCHCGAAMQQPTAPAGALTEAQIVKVMTDALNAEYRRISGVSALHPVSESMAVAYRALSAYDTPGSQGGENTARVKSPGIRQIEEPSDSSGGTPASRTGLPNNCEGSAPTLSKEEAVEIILEAWEMRQKKLSPLTRWLAEDAYRALAKRLGWVDVPFVEGE